MLRVTKSVLKETAKKLRNVRANSNQAFDKDLSEAVAVLDSIVERAKQVVDDCVHGYSQSAEEFACQLGED